MTGLKPYMAFAAGDGPEEGACLVFAHTTREARKVAWPIIDSWWVCDYTDLRVRKLEATDYLMSLYKKEEPHAIESPPVCEACGQWCEDPPGACVLWSDCPGNREE